PEALKNKESNIMRISHQAFPAQPHQVWSITKRAAVEQQPVAAQIEQKAHPDRADRRKQAGAAAAVVSAVAQVIQIRLRSVAAAFIESQISPRSAAVASQRERPAPTWESREPGSKGAQISVVSRGRWTTRRVATIPGSIQSPSRREPPPVPICEHHRSRRKSTG
ncbi:hypothetical protein HAX54_016342, partial [Datura stramonium]|nr:hypothetical protein [Datura stramonium]